MNWLGMFLAPRFAEKDGRHAQVESFRITTKGFLWRMLPRGEIPRITWFVEWFEDARLLISNHWLPRKLIDRQQSYSLKGMMDRQSSLRTRGRLYRLLPTCCLASTKSHSSFPNRRQRSTSCSRNSTNFNISLIMPEIELSFLFGSLLWREK